MYIQTEKINLTKETHRITTSALCLRLASRLLEKGKWERLGKSQGLDRSSSVSTDYTGRAMKSEKDKMPRDAAFIMACWASRL